MEPRIRLDDSAAFARAVTVLDDFKRSSPRLLSANFAVEVAVLMHRILPDPDGAQHPTRVIAAPGQGAPIPTHDLQEIVNTTYEKNTAFVPPDADGPVYKPFTRSFKSAKRNNWRNSFDLQRGLACDAPYTSDFLQSPEYLSEQRFYCPLRNQSTGLCESPAGVTSSSSTCFNPSKHQGTVPGPDSRAQPAPKLLTRTSSPTVGYWYIEPTPEALVDLIGSATARVPLYPFIAALYCGSPYLGERGAEAGRERFEVDLSVSEAQLVAIFDVDPESELNRRLRGRSKRTRARRATRETDGAVPPHELSAPVAYRPRTVAELESRAGTANPSQRLRMLERSRVGHKRTLDALAELLAATQPGLKLSEQLDGFDLMAERDEEALLFEVKTWTAANFGKQVRQGWAQLREYRFRNRAELPSEVRLFLVLDREPPRDSWVWSFLVEDCDVTPAWIKDGRLTTFPRLRAALP